MSLSNAIRRLYLGNYLRKLWPAGLRAAPERDPLLSLVGTGKQLWANEHADAYVERLREEPE